MSGAFLLPHDGEKPFLEWLDWLQNLRLNQQSNEGIKGEHSKRASKALSLSHTKRASKASL